ncbi:hypothetical protein BDD12DRAFT_893963 [Trichophaea hybrida]|nr:hypothetical protein BDD12DRAFT_893963 [Trichophaea hybrida]
MDVPITPTQETNYGSFPVAGINTEEMDHEATEPVVQEDNTMTQAGDDIAEQDQQGTADSSPFSSLESTPRQLPRRPMDMFNQPGGNIIARKYHQEVGIPQTLNISPRGLFYEGGARNDQSESDNSDEELASPTAQAAQSKKEEKLMEAVGESKAIVADVQTKLDHFLTQKWPEYARVHNNACKIVDNKLNNLHRMSRFQGSEF